MIFHAVGHPKHNNRHVLQCCVDKRNLRACACLFFHCSTPSWLRSWPKHLRFCASLLITSCVDHCYLRSLFLLCPQHAGAVEILARAPSQPYCPLVIVPYINQEVHMYTARSTPAPSRSCPRRWRSARPSSGPSASSSKEPATRQSGRCG